MTKLVETLQNLLIFITLLLSSIPEMVYPGSNKLREIFCLFNRSLNLALHRALLLLFSVETKKRRTFRLPINLLPKTSLL